MELGIGVNVYFALVLCLSALLTAINADDICQPGELLTLPNDPCKTCVCGNNFLPTDRCTTIPCIPPVCPNGTVTVYQPEKCCQYDCVTVTKECIPGRDFFPPEIGCAGCQCGEDGFRKNCVEYMAKCHVPECHPPETGQRRPGECCGFYCAKPQARDPTCYRPILRGCPVGRSYMLLWGYDTRTKLCELYVAGDCKGYMHENSFSSKEICEQQCYRSGEDPVQVPSKENDSYNWSTVLVGVTFAVTFLIIIAFAVVLVICRKRMKQKGKQFQQNTEKTTTVKLNNPTESDC